MTHLCLHVVEKLTICGSVHVRWMYPIESVLKTLKVYVRNKAWPKALMVEKYIYEENIGFVSEYMQKLNV